MKTLLSSAGQNNLIFKETIMNEKMKRQNIKMEVRFADGSSRSVSVNSEVLALLRRFSGRMPFLFEGTGLNPCDADFSNIIAITRADHDAMHQLSANIRCADFRLGQLDMRASVCDMLRTLADGASDPVSAGLILAADLVENMEVPYADT